MLDVKFKIRPGHARQRDWMAPSPLRQLFWNVTYACNYRCEVCFADAAVRHPDELTTQEAMDLVRQAHEAGVKDIIISGGEPFMRGDLPEILACMARLGMTARIASNGSLLTEDLLDRLRRDTLTKSFQISLDTLDHALYRRLHGAPADGLDGALAALRAIKERGLHTTVSVRLTPGTLPGIPDLLERAVAEGWATVTVHCPLHTGRAGGAWPQDADVLGMLAPAFDRFASLPECWLVETYIPWAQYHPVVQRLAEQVNVVHRGCTAGRDRLTVNPTGAVSPCVCLDAPAAHLGNVRRDGLREMFERSPVCRMMRQPAEHGICARCAHVAACGGGCRAAAYVLTGRLDGQDTSCPVWQRRAAAREAQADGGA